MTVKAINQSESQKKNREEILLVFPSINYSYKGRDTDVACLEGIPIGAIALAAYLETLGYTVHFIDGRLYPKDDILDMLDQICDRISVIGFSVMTCQVAHALALSEHVREYWPNVKVVWGGMHPTFFPESTCSDPAIDYVVYNEGECAMEGLMAHLEDSTSYLINRVPNLVYRTESGAIVQNAIAPLLDPNALPLPAYHLLDIEQYINRQLLDGRSVRGLDILSSRGCPHRCAFCIYSTTLKRNWRPIRFEILTETVKNLVETYDLNHIWFMDDYFFGSTRRSRNIAEFIKDKVGRKLFWEINIRATDFRPGKMDDDNLKLFSESGCYAFRIGAESGSDETLSLIDKDITVKDIRKAVESSCKYKIMPALYFMMGIPDETIENVLLTFDFLYQTVKAYPEVWISGPGMFRPQPGGKLFQRCIDYGFEFFQTPRDWAAFNPFGILESDEYVWIEDPKMLLDLFSYFQLYFKKQRLWHKLARRPQFHEYLARIFFGFIAEWRFKTRHFGSRLDLRVLEIIKEVIKKSDRVSVCPPQCP